MIEILHNSFYRFDGDAEASPDVKKEYQKANDLKNYQDYLTFI
jgi:hypothetical protein